MLSQSYRGPDQSYHSRPGDVSAQPMVKKPLKPLYKPPYFVASSACFIMSIVGAIFFFISFGGPAWYDVPRQHTIVPKTFGLWRFCVRSECVVDMTNDYMVKRYLVFEDDEQRTLNPEVIYAYENFLVSVKVLMCIAVIGVFTMITTSMAFMAGFPTFFLEGISQLFSGLLVGLAVGIFGGNFRDDVNFAPFGWAYWCGVVTTIIFLANGAGQMAISVFVYKKRRGFRRN